MSSSNSKSMNGINGQYDDSAIFDTPLDTKATTAPSEPLHPGLVPGNGNGDTGGPGPEPGDPGYGNWTYARKYCLSTIYTTKAYALCINYTDSQRQTLLDNCELDTLVSFYLEESMGLSVAFRFVES